MAFWSGWRINQAGPLCTFGPWKPRGLLELMVLPFVLVNSPLVGNSLTNLHAHLVTMLLVCMCLLFVISLLICIVMVLLRTSLISKMLRETSPKGREPRRVSLENSRIPKTCLCSDTPAVV